MFPCFIISDANYHSITCNSNSLILLPPRCNEDPVCRNPRGFRIAIYAYTYAAWGNVILVRPTGEMRSDL